ncbi:Peroxiredoxin [Prosthecobacter debontii]|uniref:Peroxiredoxin n=1 Tax=Prosthecobacter debontii TaxID=48467 RepID=A0A1T4XRY1_9BACT|nr:redoxin domain-containing protein [Prosthecobacter debontii]SKA92320.1 Peroxiredoxin [Prosthecobacter debontii]
MSNRLLVASLFLSLAASHAAEPLPGHSAHGEAFNEGPRQAAVLIPGTGKVSFPVTTTSQEAQAFFNQGVGQLHGFLYYEAERSFRQVAVLDQDCAMAYWGMAMANVNNDKRAREFVKEAVALKAKAGAEEKLWITTLETFYNDDKRDKKQRALDFIRDLETIVQDYPEDVEAKAFLAWKIWHAKDQAPISSPQAVDALLDQVFAVNPEHPAHHYRIHLWDGSKPIRALKSAASNGQAAPGIAHMWHMPGHTFSKLKRYDDAAWQQEASTRVDHASMTRSWILPDQIHNYAHNEEWLVRTFNELGRAQDAIGLAKSLIKNPRHPQYNTLEKGSARYGVIRLLETLQTWEIWEEVLSVTNGPWVRPMADAADAETARLKARGLAFYAQDEVNALEATLNQLQTLNQTALKKRREADAKAAKEKDKAKDREQEKSKDNKKPDKPDEGPAAEALKTLQACHAVLLPRRDAAAIVEAVQKDISKPLAASLWLKLGQKAKAEALLKDWPEDLAAQLAKVELKMALDKKAEAKQDLEKAGKLAFAMDRHLPVSQRMDALAKQLGVKGDWRAPAPVRQDSGQRPALDTLGPIHWQPPQVPTWEALTLEGQPVTAEHFHGKPHLLLFYLGSACGHCMQQIKAFAKEAPSYRKAGIELAAITLEPMSLAGRITEQMPDKKLPPFSLFCDPGLTMFKSFKAYDDFEQEPLHAAVLVDAHGKVRWWDVSWEPFTDAGFLLREAKRLLQWD